MFNDDLPLILFWAIFVRLLNHRSLVQIAIFIVLGTGLLFALLSRLLRGDPGRKISICHDEMAVLANEVVDMSIDIDVPAAPWVSGRSSFTAAELADALVRWRRNFGYGETPRHLARPQAFTDPWGRTFNFGLESNEDGDEDGNQWSVIVWSNGPNGKNENGEGDDLHLVRPIRQPTGI